MTPPPAREARVALELSECCIETAARREHARLVGAMIRGERVGSGDADRLELLREFLERHDFQALRRERPELAGAAGVRVEICRDSAGRASWRLVPRDA